MLNTLFLLYLVPIILVVWMHLHRKKRMQRRQRSRLEEAVQSGLTEPPSLHPVVDSVRCIGSGGCVKACPEHALGIVNGKGVLVAPTKCIGHGACEVSCPVEAITLVFGTEKRGVDIPYVKPDFETNVPGIFIAGELGGMGLIRKAVEQGKQAITAIAQKRASGNQLDVLIVGAGPAGLGAALAATEQKLRFVIVEQEDSVGGAIYHYPRNKIAMTAPMNLPLVGKVRMYEISKEELLGFWQRVIRDHALDIHFNEILEAITKAGNGFTVKTSKCSYQTRNILLAIGRRGSPRKLGVPGEEQAKVVYRLIDAEQYRGLNVLVVGGGDSALEAALALSEQHGTTVTLSYRSEAFGRVKEKNRKRLEEAGQRQLVTVLLKSDVQCIDTESVTIEQAGDVMTIPNDAVIVCAGGVLPTPMLKDIGIKVETHFGIVKGQ